MTESFAYRKCNHIQLIISLVCLFIKLMDVAAWEDRRHLAMLPLVFPPNDVWETSTEIPYWWRITTQIWVVLLIGWIKFPMQPTNQIWVVTRHQYGIPALVSQTSFGGGGTSGSVAKCCRTFLASSWETSASREKRTVHLTFHYTVMHLTLSLCRLN